MSDYNSELVYGCLQALALCQGYRSDNDQVVVGKHMETINANSDMKPSELFSLQ